MEPTKMEKCPHCGCTVERHRTASRGWIVHCSDCGLTFGVNLPPADVFDERVINSRYWTSEDAAVEWNKWVKGVRNEQLD